MSLGAIIMMIIAILVVWGGLVGALVLIRLHPETPEDTDEPVEARG